MTNGKTPLIVVDARAARARMSGVGRYVLNLISELVELGEERYAVIVSDDPHPELLSLKRVDFIEGGAGAAATAFVDRLSWEQRVLPRVLKSSGADLFHATWNYGVPWNCPCPAVVTIHDLIPLQRSEFGSRSNRLAFMTSQYLALGKAARVIAVSSATRDEIRRHAPWAIQRVSVIREAATPMFCPDASEGAIAVEPGVSPYLLYVGGVDPRKNLANLFRAFENLSSMGLSLRLTIEKRQLDGAMLQAHNAMSEAAQQQIVYVGKVSDHELVRLYQGAAALVHPSEAEGFGLPLLEAMACGTPVVTTKCGSIPEIVGDCAIFVEPGDPTSIAEGVRRLLADDGLRQKLEKEGRRRAGEFTWRKAAEETAATYREVLSPSKRKSA